MTNNEEILAEVSKLLKEFQAIGRNLAASQQGPDGIIKSIAITLEKLHYIVSNNLVVSLEAKEGLNNSCAAAARLFEGSGIDDDLFKIKDLLGEYVPI